MRCASVLYDGQLDTILFPADPIANAATILDNMAAIFPPREGQYLFGPMARIAFSQPPLIEGKLGVVLELGSEFRLLILGALGSHLPTRGCAARLARDDLLRRDRLRRRDDLVRRDAPEFARPHLGRLRRHRGRAPAGRRASTMSSPSAGCIRAIRARRTCPTCGGCRSISAPTIREITLWAYQAVTLNSLQFGAGADLYAKGPEIPLVGRLAAEGTPISTR